MFSFTVLSNEDHINTSFCVLPTSYRVLGSTWKRSHQNAKTSTAQLSTLMLQPFSILLNKYSNENLLEKCPNGHMTSTVGKETNPIWVKFIGLVH